MFLAGATILSIEHLGMQMKIQIRIVTELVSAAEVIQSAGNPERRSPTSRIRSNRTRAMVASLRKAWLTSSRPTRGGEFHGGDANSNRRPATAAIAPAAVCMHESCIAARMAVGQCRNAVATARRSVERGVLGGYGAAGGPIPRVQCETSGSEDKRETESVGALCNAGAPNGTGVWIREAHTAEGGNILSKSNNGRYRIFLLDSLEYTEEMVENALTKAVPVITSEDARLCFYDALYMGESLVTVADEEHAKKYATAMVLLGLYVKITKEDETTF